MKLNLSNTKNESKNVKSAQVINNAAAIAEPIEDAVIVSEEIAHEVKSEKRKVKNEKPATKAAANSKPSTLNSQLSLVTYTTKKGGTACYITGFKTEADAKAMADQLPHSISNSYRYSDKGEKVYVLSFGTRYVDAASSMCEALNAGKKTDLHAAIAKCHEIYNAVVSSAKAEREKKTQERKAERAKAKADELAKVKKANGLYSMDDIAAMMKRALAGEDIPELAAVKEALEAA